MDPKSAPSPSSSLPPRAQHALAVAYWLAVVNNTSIESHGEL